jgi:hypothetical protein
MFTPITNTTAIGYARSLERLLDFITDMRDVQLPSKLADPQNKSMINDFSLHIPEELYKLIDSIGASYQSENALIQKL